MNCLIIFHTNPNMNNYNTFEPIIEHEMNPLNKLCGLRNLILFLFILQNLTIQAQILHVQGDVVNVRNSASTSGAIVVKAKRLDQLSLIRRDKIEVLNGIEDYWYFVKTESGKEGYVFGHFTSLKREGQKTADLTLNDVSMGDCYHLVFGDIDFGSGYNNLGDFDAISEDESNPEPRFVGKRFRVTYNDLYCLEYPMCNPDLAPTTIQTPTIVKLELLK